MNTEGDCRGSISPRGNAVRVEVATDELRSKNFAVCRNPSGRPMTPPNTVLMSTRLRRRADLARCTRARALSSDIPSSSATWG